MAKTSKAIKNLVLSFLVSKARSGAHGFALFSEGHTLYTHRHTFSSHLFNVHCTAGTGIREWTRHTFFGSQVFLYFLRMTLKSKRVELGVTFLVFTRFSPQVYLISSSPVSQNLLSSQSPVIPLRCSCTFLWAGALVLRCLQLKILQTTTYCVKLKLDCRSVSCTKMNAKGWRHAKKSQDALSKEEKGDKTCKRYENSL